MKTIRIGISGWTYPPWRGVFFPKDLPQRRELEFASRQVNSIEINASFYSLQRPKSYRAWHDATPRDFVFSVKGGRFITHLKRLKDVEKPLANFFASGVLSLGEKLGPILWQLPPSFRFDHDRLASFFDLLPRRADAAITLARKHDGRVQGRVRAMTRPQRPIRHALEVRHPTFERESFVALLREYEIALVVADTAGRWPFIEDITSNFIARRRRALCQRLHQRGVAGMGAQDSRMGQGAHTKTHPMPRVGRPDGEGRTGCLRLFRQRRKRTRSIRRHVTGISPGYRFPAGMRENHVCRSQTACCSRNSHTGSRPQSRLKKETMPETEEEISRQPEVRGELERTAPRKPIKAETKDKFWFVVYLLLLLGCALLYSFLGSKFFPLSKARFDLIHRILRGAAMIVSLLGISSAISIYAISRVSDPATRFTLKRIKRLLVFLLTILVTLSVLFVNWYTALISVGVISVIAGLAVQTPMTSFIGWIYLLVRQPYRVGDRIKISDSTGDVIDVGYLDTTLWEFGGDYISGDHPSGRIIRFPNSKVLDSIIYNYSWPVFPYIWNEIKVQVAYNSDLEFIAQTMRRVTEEDLGEAMIERVQIFRKLLARTPVDQLEVQERPRVIFRVSENTWLEAIVRYVIPPRESGATKSRLIKKILAALNAEPSRVCFPAGANR